MSTATAKILEAFENGHELTAKQIVSRYKVSNPHDVVYRLRNSGYAIYLNSRKNSKGETVSKYRLGNPSRAMLADWAARGITPAS